MMEKKELISQFKLLAQLAALHKESPFKIRAYERAIETLQGLADETLKAPVSSWPVLEGIGDSLKKELLQAESSGTLARLDSLKQQTPTTLLPLLSIRGISATKLGHLWRELGVEKAEDLASACKTGQVAKQKGFGTKTEDRLLELLAFYQEQQGKIRWDQALALASCIEKGLVDAQPSLQFQRTGLLLRSEETISSLEWIIIQANREKLTEALDQLPDYTHQPSESSPWTLRGRSKEGIRLLFYLCRDEKEAKRRYFISSASALHLSLCDTEGRSLYSLAYQDEIEEASLYASCGLPLLPPPLRETASRERLFQGSIIDSLVQKKDLKGVLHCHSNYSDGRNTLEEMAAHALSQGYQYLGISDHSQSAFYARGLSEERIALQHREIDQLNDHLAPFRILKGIECDILPDGSLDYSDEVLSSFDFVIISIHSQLHMDKERATARLLRAIANPYAQILAHPTGRLLLQRAPYELDYSAVLHACAQHEVAIEFNASAYRLDLSWVWISAAREAGLLISLNPDAHDLSGIEDICSSLPIAQKGGLTKQITLNAFSSEALAERFSQKKKRAINPKAHPTPQKK